MPQRDAYRAMIGGGCLFLIVLVWVGLSDAAVFYDPLPSANAKMRARVERSQNPSIVILGSSRPAFAIIPDLLASELGLPKGAVVNAAFPGMMPDTIRDGYEFFEAKLRSARLVLYFSDDYYLHAKQEHDRAKRTPADAIERELSRLIQKVSGIRKIRNFGVNVYNEINPFREDRYRLDEEGLLRNDYFGRVDSITDPETRARHMAGMVVAWWQDFTPEPDAIRRLISFGQRIKDNGARIVFIHMPVHPGYREAMLVRHAPDWAWYLNGMNTAASSLGSIFYNIDRPEDGGIDASSFTFDAIHLGPKEARRYTRSLATLIRSEFIRSAGAK